MAVKAPQKYIKYIYWLPKEKEEELRAELRGRNKKLKSGKAVVCPGLDEITEIISVSPDVWAGTCNRQGSWYRQSDKNGLYLIISSYELGGWEHYQEAIISGSDFRLPRGVTRKEKEEMVKDADFRSIVPKDWFVVSDLEQRLWTRWARRLGSQEDWDSLFLTHTACHANFIKPRLFLDSQGQRIPYSIDKSANLCSCCLELFQVVGASWHKKLVAPCAGAVIFARLPADRYLLVEKP